MAVEEPETLLDVAIYKLSINSRADLFYIGSSVDVVRRITKHRAALKTRNSKLYKAIRENDGEFEVEILYEFQCKNEKEQWQEEQVWIDELKPTLNSNRAYNSEEQRCKAWKEYKKQWDTDNREHKKTYYGQWYIQNKTEILKNVTCICGCDVTSNGLTRHMKNKKHHTRMALLNSK